MSLEDLLQAKTAASECQGCSLRDSYVAMKSYLERHYYPWISSNCPWYTDHGKEHVTSVMHTAGLLLSSVQPDSLTCLDVFLLLVAIIWHDVGMVADRSTHADMTGAFIEKVREFCLSDQTLHRLVSLMVTAHSGEDKWSSLQPSEPVDPCSHKTCTVNPQSLAAVLRFADEVSETRNRISPVQLPNVPIDQRIFWEYAHCVTASRPEPLRRRLLLAAEVQHESALARFPCPANLLHRADTSGQISLIEYFVCRLEKMNNERAYCFPYLTRYADIRTIEVRLTILQGTDAKWHIDDLIIGDGGLSSSGYPSIDVFEPFFSAYPELRPAPVGGVQNGI